jgi:hypothetical protein
MEVLGTVEEIMERESACGEELEVGGMGRRFLRILSMYADKTNSSSLKKLHAPRLQRNSPQNIRKGPLKILRQPQNYTPKSHCGNEPQSDVRSA